MKNLFQEFDPTNYTEWLEKIKMDLKGKPIDVLHSKPEPDLDVVAYHHPEKAVDTVDRSTGRNLSKAQNTWKIRQEFNAGGKEVNTAILNALNDGVDAVGLTVNADTDFDTLTKDVLFEHIGSDISFNDVATATNFKQSEHSFLNYDIISLNAKTGDWQHDLNDYLSFYNQHATKTIWVSGYHYGAAGASTVQELAFTLAHANEYIQFLYDNGKSLAEINERLIIELSVNENYFVNIAKFRVIKDLLRLVFEGYDATYTFSNPVIYAKTNIRHLAKNDQNNNPLRETTQAMSAVIGGCDVLTVQYGDYPENSIEEKRFQRIARNIQLILKEESYLDKVVDPGAGSYYLESLSQQILEKSWNLFLEIEKQGGLIKGLQSNQIQERIGENRNQLIANMQQEKTTFLGVNKYPNSMEKWTETSAPKDAEANTFLPLVPFYLENYFTQTTVES